MWHTFRIALKNVHTLFSSIHPLTLAEFGPDSVCVWGGGACSTVCSFVIFVLAGLTHVKNFIVSLTYRLSKNNMNLKQKKTSSPLSPSEGSYCCFDSSPCQKSRLDYSGSHHNLKIFVIFTDQYRKKSQISVLFVCLVHEHSHRHWGFKKVQWKWQIRFSKG